MEQCLDKPIIWVDLEMTGLNYKSDVIMEIAVVVTDGSLDNVRQGPDIVIGLGEELLNGMNDFCRNLHQKNGLTE